MKFKEVHQITKINTYVYREMKAANTFRFIRGVLATLGGFLLLWLVSNLIAGNQITFLYSIIGGGTILLTVPILLIICKHLGRLIDIYNSGVFYTSGHQSVINLSLPLNGIRINFSF